MNLENFVHNGKKAIKTTICAGLASVMLFLTGCPPVVTPPEPPPETPTELPDTSVLTPTEAAGISNVNPDSLTFSSPVDYIVGDIIVSGITNNTPEGLFREVTGVSSDERTLYTETASLEEAISNADFEFSSALSPNGASFSGLRGISAPQRDLTGAAFHLAFEDVVLFDLDGNPSTTWDQITADGTLSFNINVSIGAKIANYSLQKIKFQVQIPESLDLEIGVLGNVGSFDLKKTVGEFNLPPFLIGTIPCVPPIPLIVKPKFEIVVGIGGQISDLTAKVNQEATATVGLAYENSSWSPIKQFTNSFEFTPPTLSNTLSVEAYAGPKLAFRLYGVAGPYGELNGSLRLELDGSNHEWNLYGGLEAVLGVDVKIFKKTLLDYSLKVLDFEKWLAGGNNGNPSTRDKLLFVTGREGIVIDSDYAQIYTMDSNGSNLKNLTNFRLLFNDYDPCWSPDGKKIAFVSKQDGNKEIYTMNSDGSNPQRLTNNSADDFDPDWSPDGTKILFVTNRDPTYSRKIWVMNADGTSQQKLGNLYNVNSDPRWSPDGTKIVFSSIDPNGRWGIYTANSDGDLSSRLKLIDGGSEYAPSWSPDGTKIALVSGRDGNNEIYTMNSNGSNLTRLTNNSATDSNPSWSRDGKKIFFVSNRNQYLQLHVMNADGSGVYRIPTKDYCHDNYPRVCPVPAQ